MNARLMFGAALFAVVFATGCRHKKVTISVVANVVQANPDPLKIRQASGNFKVTWKFPASAPWLVQFLDDSPCGSVHVLQSGGTETCAIDLGGLVYPSYKYYALSGPYISADPQIYHKPTVTKGKPLPPSSPKPTVVCLNLANGSPMDCNGGTTIISTVMVSKGDDIYWTPNNGWEITIAQGVCGDGGAVTKISSANAYCSVSKTAASSTYMYTVVLNQQQHGPFYVKVN
jgi:hypothetical protein